MIYVHRQMLHQCDYTLSDYQPESVKLLKIYVYMIVVGKTLLLIVRVSPRVVFTLQCIFEA